MGFAVRAETHEGKLFNLRVGFSSRAAAEDHPVKLSLWKRVWVEETPSIAAQPIVLPPMPWTVDVVDGGYGGKTNFMYIKDANGRRIMSLLGKPEEKELMAAFICNAARSAP